MGVFSKVFSIVKGKANDAGLAYVDKNAIILLKQQVREAETAQREAKNSLVELMASKSTEEQKVQAFSDEINKYKTAAKKALEKGDNELAKETASKIAILINKQNEHQKTASNYGDHIEGLKEQVKDSQHVIDNINEQLAIVESTDKVQKAEAKIDQSMASNAASKSSALETLNKIKEKQQTFDNKVRAAKALDAETNGANLDEKLEQSGFLDNGQGSVSADDILAELKEE